MKERPIPKDSKCPKCGGDPIPEEVTMRLSSMGYHHNDQKQVCEECGNQWKNGIPIGSPDPDEMGGDLWCTSCDSGYMFVHRVKPGAITTLHLKCPNEDCYHFKKVDREPDSTGLTLVGYPNITGNMDGARPSGYRSD